jgi:hypothetical protein
MASFWPTKLTELLAQADQIDRTGGPGLSAATKSSG